jgi:hypothetical protein
MAVVVVEEQIERLGQLADEADNLIAASKLAMPPAFHVDQLRKGLRKLSEQIKALVVEIGGEDPWEGQPPV